MLSVMVWSHQWTPCEVAQAPHLMLTQLAPITTTVIVGGIVEQLADRGIVEQLIALQYLFVVVLTSKYLCSYDGMITG